ncbi:MAG: murein biosynthesis integral membrane protein MurJ [Candidatus Beckwithbacteria bacterium]
MVSTILNRGQSLFNRRQSSTLSAASILMAAVFLSRILGLLRDRFLAGAFFDATTSWQLDIYFAAFRLPDMIFQLLVVGALSAAFIPVFSKYLFKKQTEAWHIASSVITIGLVLFLILGSVLAIFSLPLSRLIAPSFTPANLQLMANLTRVLILAQAFFLISNFLTGILQSHHYFLVPALAPVAYNLGIIFGTVCLSPILGIYGPAVGVILGAFLHFLVQVPLTKSLGFRYQPIIDLHHPGVRRIGRLMLPRAIALAVSQIELTVAVFLATSLPAGSLAIFYFAQHLNALPVGLFGATIGQAALPSLAQNFSVKSFLASLNQVLYLSLPAGMILLILRLPIVRLAFGTKNFPWQATLLTGQAVALFAVSVFAQAAIQILVRGFYALSNTRTPLYLAAVAVFTNVALSFVFVYSFGLGILGLALALSIASFIHSGLLLFFLARQVNGFPRPDLLIPFIKMSFAALITGFSLWVPLRLLDRYILNTTKTLDLIILSLITGLIGFSVYLLLSKLLKIKELDSFLGLIKRFLHLPKLLSQTDQILNNEL